MPIYDYICTACDHRADILHGINDPGPNFCPSCGGEGTMKKQFSTPAIHFKGSGWAKKDRGGSSTSTKAAAKAASSSEPKAEAKGESGSASGSGTSSSSESSSGGSSPSASTD